MSWATLAEARQVWTDSARIPDATLQILLEAVKPAIVAYAPYQDGAPDPSGWVEDPPGSGLLLWVPAADPVPPYLVPEVCKLAQIMQARNVYNAGRAPAGGGDFDGSNYGIATFPLDWQVKQLLRPVRGLGAIA